MKQILIIAAAVVVVCYAIHQLTTVAEDACRAKGGELVNRAAGGAICIKTIELR